MKQKDSRAEPENHLSLPSSSAQQRLWTIQQIDPDNKAYNVPFLLTFKGNLNEAVLKESLHSLIQRHCVLRSSFRWINGELIQLIEDELTPNINSEIIKNQSELHLKIQQEISEPFILERLPLYRFQLLKHSSSLNWLVITFHHSIFDGWSASLFFEDLRKIYASLAEGINLGFTDISRKYADYFNWEKTRMQDGSLNYQMEYWKKRLSGELPKLLLPTDRYRSSVRVGQHGGVYSHDLPEELSNQIKTFSKTQKTSLFITLLACFKTLLYRYTQQDDLMIGIPFANRNQENVSELIGFFVNTLVIRTTVSDSISFQEYLAQVHTAAIEAYCHSDLPFDAVVKAVQPVRDDTASPLIQVMFNQREFKTTTFELPDVHLEVEELSSGSAQFELVFNVCDLGDSIRIVAEYDSGLFNSGSIQRFVDYFAVLTKNLVSNPYASIDSLSLSETKPMFVELEKPLQLGPFPNQTGLHKLFEEQAKKTPDAVAIEYNNYSLTYGELNQMANRLAHHLIARGVERNTLVGLGTNRSFALAVGILGILKAGGAYVPMDPAYPADRLEYLIEDSGVQFIVVQDEVLGNFSRHNLVPISINSYLMVTDGDPVNPVIDSSLEDSAYVIYTSGSTGKPKGCLIQHRSVIRLFESTHSWFQFQSSDIWTLFHSYSFDFSVWEFWGALLFGGRLIIVPTDIIRSPVQFLDLIVQRKVTVLNQTPSAFWPLMDVICSPAANHGLDLRVIVFGGERLEFERLEPWYHHFEEDSPQLINMYGITETTVHNTFRKIGRKDTAPGSISCIGEPLPDLKLYVLDKHLNSVPVGIPGELYISGPGVASGYLHRPELTMDRFISNPFLQEEHGLHERLYRTGDQVRQISEVDYEYWGRLDAQVKIRGYRIELSEIEAVIRGMDGVTAAVVIPYSNNEAPPRLIAYVVTNGKMSSTAVMYQEIRKSLPSFMTPALFVEVPAIPITPNGKVDKSKLPIPTIELETESAYFPAQSPLEKQLVEIWSEVLGVQKVGVEHNFFQIGGDSIRSIQLVSSAQKKGIELKVEHIFQFPTIRELASLLLSKELKNTPEWSYEPFSLIPKEDLSLLPEEVHDAYPLTLLQQGMMFHSEYSPEEASYCEMNSLLLCADFDRQALEAALNSLVKRHAILRTTFLMEGFRESIQIVNPYSLVPVYEEDIRGLGPEEQAYYIQKWWEQELRKLDLSHYPVFTLTVHRRSDMNFQLCLCIHHALIDGWSVASFFTELLFLYSSILDSGKRLMAEPEPLAVSFAEYVSMEKALLQSGECHEFWQDWLKDCSIAKIPRLALKSEPVSLFSKNLVQELPKSLLSGLDKFCKSFQVPLRSVLLAVHLKVMSLLIGDHDITTGVVYNGRPETSDGEKILGLFLNTLPFRYKLENKSWIDFVQGVWEKENKLLPYRRYPLSKVMQDHGGAPLFEILFNYTNFHVYKEFEKNDSISIQDSINFSAPIYPLVVDFYRDITSGSLRLSLVWDSHEFEQIQIESIMKLYLRTLTEIARTPHLSCIAYPLLSSEEKQMILYDWNRNDDPMVGFTPVHRLFELKAASAPDKEAIIDGKARMTYNDLNIKANQVAHSLIRIGIGSSSLVGIMLNKSWEAVASILGVLKAGGTFVPLDPDYPQERLDHMIAESGIKAIISEENYMGQSNSGIQVLPLSESFNSIECGNLANTPTEEQLAYVIFTSGSTGKPKGAMNTQGGLSKGYDAWNKAYHLQNIECNLQMTSFAFDVFTADVFRTLCSGGKLLLCPQELLMNAQELYSLMMRERVDFGFFLPAVMRNLVRYLEDKNLELPDVKVIIVGADYWFVNEYNKLQQVCGPDTRVINSYGVAEATVDSIYFEGDGYRIPEQGNIPIGRPFTNMSAYILAPDLKPLYPGIIGELFIGGGCVGRGYINRPDLTDEKFINSPFVQGDRLYKTGDLGRYWPDGTIEFIGRRDHQLKVRGYRVELGEIESALRSSQGVKDAVVIASTSKMSQIQLQAYLSFEENDDMNIQQIKKNLKKKLPDYMIPNTYILLNEMPLNPNGKIDRNRIALSGGMPIKTEVPYVPARSKTELLLASIFMTILGVERISVLDNIFDIGADSLAALKILARIRAGFNIQLTLKSIFANPTIAELAKEVLSNKPGLSSLTLQQTEPMQSAPLSYAQQRIWFFEFLQPGTSTYHVPVILRFTGSLDVPALETYLKVMVNRHDALSTSIVMENGEPVQRTKFADFKLKRLDFDIGNEENAEEELQQRIAESIKIPFRLNGESLLRGEIIRIGPVTHVLILTMHHMITDGWSVDLLIRELAHLYNSAIEKKEPHLRELKFRYADFSVWQRQLVNSDGIQVQLEYWIQKLGNATEVLQLPLDFSRPKEKSYRGEVESLELPNEWIIPLQKLAQEQESTLFIILLSAYFVLLARYTGQEDIIVGTPVTNRSHTELEDLVGMFVNTLAIRSNLSSDLSFIELINDVKISLIEAIGHSDIPFEHLVSVLNPDRNLSRTPLFQTMFLMEQQSDLPVFNGLQVERVQQVTEASKCDITISIIQKNDSLSASMSYDPDLFLPSTIVNMLESFGGLLQSIVESPEAAINHHRVVTPSQYMDLLRFGTGLNKEYDETLCLHELFIRQASNTPEAIACICGNTRLSYGELNKKSNQLANFLKRLGVGKETFVGLYLESSSEMIIGLLGILKSGGAFVPLDPSMPEERINYILENSDASLIVTQSHLADKLDSYCPIIKLDEDWAIVECEAEEIDFQDNSSSSAAYVLYTTGSTGRPKGVVVEHKQIVNYVLGITETLYLNECSSFAMVQPLVVDSCQTVLFPAFYSGGTLHLITRELALNAADLSMYFKLNSIDCLKIAPSHLMALQNLSGIKDFMPKKRLILGGEASNPEWIREMLKHKGTCQIYNHYGPTETTVGISTFHVQAEEDSAAAIVPVGHPLPNVCFYIVDQNKNPVPRGVSGELWVGGSAVTRGYLHQEQLTREKYVYASFHGDGRERMYKTGDQVRMLSDGAIEFLGRLDDQVKINGYRVEPSELVYALSQIPVIREIFILPKTLQNGTKHLVAYLISNGDHKPSFEELNSHILKCLPSYFLPYAYVWLEEFPRTLQGKINRSALPEPDMQPLPTNYHAPRNELEKDLAAIWSRILAQTEIGIHDNFFQLGGDSILSMQLISQAQNMGWHLTLKHLFQYQTIAELSQFLLHSEPPMDEPVLFTGTAPLSTMQAWFFENESAHLGHWNQSLLLLVDSSLTYDVLNRAASLLINHHPALRTRFVQDDHLQWQQQTASDLPDNPIVLINLENMEEEEAETVRSRFTKHYQQSVSYSGRYLYSMVFFNRGERSKSKLLIIIHHLIVDGVSWRIITDDLKILCEQLLNRQQPKLPSPSAPFLLWAKRRSEQALQLDPKHELDQWKWLQTVNIPPLPMDYTKNNKEQTLETVTVTLDVQSTNRLIKSTPSFWGVHVNAVLLTALVKAFQQWTGQNSLLIDLESHGRHNSDLDLSRTIGWFTTLLPVFIKSESEEYSETAFNIDILLKHAEELGSNLQWLKFAHPDKDVRRKAKAVPHPDIKFNYLGQFNTLNKESILSICDHYEAEDRAPESTRTHPLCIDMMVKNNKLWMEWSFSREQFSQEQIQQLASEYIRATAEISENIQSFAEQRAVPVLLECQHPTLVPFSDANLGKIPFFCVHPITGSVHNYFELARKIKSKYCFIGIQTPSLEDPKFLFEDLTEMALYYIEAIQTVQPHGPYHLGGWSMGGMIAFEMARLLQLRKEEVKFLVIMDKDAFRPKFANEADHLIAYLFEEESPSWREEFFQMDSANQLEWLISQDQVQQRYGNNDSLFIKRRLEILMNHIHLLWNYTPQSYNGSLFVASAADTVQKIGDDPSLGWSGMVADIRAVIISGDHYSFIQDPYVDQIADQILNYIPKEVIS